MSYGEYANPIEFIKAEFAQYYVDQGPENGILQGTKYAGCATHARPLSVREALNAVCLTY